MSGVAGERFHALDAVRGGALLLGVIFHAVMSFLPGPQLWVAVDSARSVELSVLFFVLHIFRLTVFFVLAGFFARLLLQRRGVGGFIANRATRIAVPLVAGWPLVMAAIILVAIWAAMQANNGILPQAPPPPMTAETFPLTHLWFLYVLLCFYAGALVLRGLVSLIDRSGGMRARLVDPLVRAVSGWGAPVWLAAPVATTLYLTPDWYFWFGIPAADTGLVPKPATLNAYGVAFGFGWLIHRQPQVLERWGQRGGVYVGPAIAATIGCLMLVGPTPLLIPAERDLRTLGYAALYAFAAWAWTIAIIGFAVRRLSGHSPARRYLADASYWIYIVHLPIVMALQAAFAPLAWPWFTKYPLILAIAFAVMLASYQLFVRYSFIGAILNGKKQKPAKAGHAAAQLAAAE